MTIREFGRENEKTLLFFPGSCEPWQEFAYAARELAERFHVLLVTPDGHDPEEHTDFIRDYQSILWKPSGKSDCCFRNPAQWKNCSERLHSTLIRLWPVWIPCLTIHTGSCWWILPRIC